MAVDAATRGSGVTDEPDETSTAVSESADTEQALVSESDVEDSEVEKSDTEDTEAEFYPDGDESTGEDEPDAAKPVRRSLSPLQLAAVAGLIVVVALGGLTGWLGYQAHRAQQTKAEQQLFLEVAKQGALNLTTIGYQEADTDVQRILDSATGEFRDEFAQNAQPFVDVVKKAQSSSQGTVSEAGLESVNGDEAQAIVAVAVKTSAVGAPDQPIRSWRMRLTVQRMGDEVKIAKVGFVS